MATLLLACARSDHATERAAILALYQSQRTAHFRQDAGMFLAAVDSGYLAIGNGTSQYRRKPDALTAVNAYLKQTTFTEVRDVVPPRITITDDARTAWLIGEVEVRGVQLASDGGKRPVAFRAAWLDMYQKTELGWRLRARANTQRDIASKGVDSAMASP